MALSISDWEPALKEVYTKKEVACLAFKKNVLLGILPKERSGGDYFVQPIWTQPPGGASASMTRAQANGYGSRTQKLNITRVPMFQRVAVNAHLMASGEKPEETMIKVSKEFDNGYKFLAEKIEKRLFRSGTGVVGRVKGNTTVTGTTIYLTDKADVFNFAIGDIIRFATTDGGVLHAGGTSGTTGATVTARSTTAGTITAGTADLSAEQQMALGDYIYIDGDGADGSTNVCMAGLEDWLPVTDRTAKLAASFFGLTRSSRPEDLGGVYIDGTAGNGDANDILVELLSEVDRNGGDPDLAVCGIDFMKELTRIWTNTKQQWQNVAVSGRQGDLVISKLYPGIKAFVAGREIVITPTRNCPSNRLYALTTDTWTIRHAGESLPMFANEITGSPMLREATWITGQTDIEVESWLAGYANLGCERPGHNGVAKIPAL